MTVKRFDFNLAIGEDEHKGLIFCNGKILKTTDVVYLLNELWKENVQLNREFDRIYEIIKQQKGLISEQAIQLDYLQAENQHMKEVLETNEWLKKSIKRQELSNEECSKYIKEVVKENEQLKKEVENLIDINARCCNEYSYFHKRMMKLEKENDKKEEEITVLKSTNMEMEDYIGRLEEQLDYIQNSITLKLLNQKTKIGEKALKEVVQDYNEWMLGHK